MTHAELTSPLSFTAPAVATSRTQVLVGRALSGIAVLFLTFDGVVKLIPSPMLAEASQQLGYSGDTIFGIGVLLLACVATYVVPQTSVFGALLLTGYLGGAVATHVRVGNPLFTHILFPTYVAALLWGGLLLPNPSLRVLLPFGRR
jgi:hypothetical protein